MKKIEKDTSGTSRTLVACYLGSASSAIIVNFAPLLFLIFHDSLGISLNKITILISLNFIIQLTVDFVSAIVIDKIGYRRAIISGQIISATGIAGIGIFPSLFKDPFTGLLIAVILYAIGGGLDEVLISPMVEACPTKNKSAHMAFLHSFYSWGHVFVVLVSTLFFVVFGTENWRLLAVFWSLLPLCDAILFCFAPIYQLNDGGKSLPTKTLISQKKFWIFALIMLCAGASEQGMIQWASAFAEEALNVSKTVGDLAGPCLFAVLMGFSRVLYARFNQKINLSKYILFCCALCFASYLVAALAGMPIFALSGCALCGFAVGIMWPGTCSIASDEYPRGGTALFAYLALAGDLGCSIGPGVVGLVADAAGENLKAGLLTAAAFPLLLGIILFAFGKRNARKAERSDSL